MNIIETKKSFLEKNLHNLNKAEYIKNMYKSHKNLFLYSELIKYTNISKIIIEDNSVIMVTRDLNIKLICKQDDERIVPIEILNFGNYEKKEMDFITKVIKLIPTPKKSILDIGANIGYISLLLEKLFSDITIYAFEPIPDIFQILKKNIEINNSKNINIYNYGLSDSKKTIDFFYYPEGSCNSSMANLSKREDVVKIKSQIEKMDDFVKNTNISIDFIKCDVEGAEILVFKGGQNTINKNKPVIYTELLRKWSKEFNYCPDDVIHLLSKLGYSCFIISDEKLCQIETIDENTIETNFLFLNQEKHKNIIEKFCV